MKREVSPAVIVVALVVVVALVGMFGYKAMRPGTYQMSPGGGPRKLTAGAVPSASSGGSTVPMSGTRGAGNMTHDGGAGGGPAGQPGGVIPGLGGSRSGSPGSGSPGSGG